MPINPVSDLVLDVARAADPVRSRAAVARLAEAAGPTSSFASALQGAASTLDRTATAFLDENGDVPEEPGRAAGGADLRPDVLDQLAVLKSQTRVDQPILSPEQRFESFIVRSSVETMMAGEGDALFGDKVSGPVWRSMLADKIADAVAKRGSLGIGDLVRRLGETA
ncbi:rod-binding protein [Chthonobacter rhizosphaerae]|uniref:rod-binding protein n=1 Tax=Chthonobacter rhizosphaerae TaxID=2735553 RepID=UPI0015EE72C4|nr:rod-binding protein [Chthonobacter rhizosphaerae]